MNEKRVRDPITQQAADWFVENRAGLDAEQRCEFTAWLKASPAHVEEYLALTVLARDFSAACESSGESREQLVAHARRDGANSVRSLWPSAPDAARRVHSPRWRAFAVMASLAMLTVGLLSLGRFRSTRPSISDDVTAMRFQAPHGEQRTYQLADHSVIHLNTDTAVTVRIGARERLVILEAGEAAFEVTHEASRPFRVSAGSAQMLDLGTQFDVRLEPSETLVTVTEGRVSVGLAQNNRMPTLELHAGQQVRVVEGDWPARPILVDAKQTTAWLRHQIRFDNEPLARVTSELNRYAPTPFEIVTPGLQKMKISGVFTTDDTNTFIAFLRGLPGVQVEVTPTRILVSQH